jgi:hypothetical protein
LFVFFERRLGKTSLIQSVLARLSKKRTLAAYVDLWPTDNEATFVATIEVWAGKEHKRDQNRPCSNDGLNVDAR